MNKPAAPQDRLYSAERLTAFSDGIFAFAITLLVITIPYPHFAATITMQQFVEQLSGLKQYFLSYLISFYIVGVFWFAHQSVFHYIKRFNRRIFMMNLAFLLFIAFLPFPTALLGRYGSQQVVAAFYAAILSVMNLILYALWVYASSHDELLIASADKRDIDYERNQRLAACILFITSIGLAGIRPFYAELAWLAAAFLPLLRRRAYLRH